MDDQAAGPRRGCEERGFGVPSVRRMEGGFPGLYLKGVAAGEMSAALAALVGPDAKGLSSRGSSGRCRGRSAQGGAPTLREEHRHLRGLGGERLTDTRYLWLYHPDRLPEHRWPPFKELIDGTSKTARC